MRLDTPAMSRLTPLALLLVAFLAACTPLRIAPPVNPEWKNRQAVLADIRQWEFTGSISVRDENESHSSRIRWQQQQERYRINLWGTFNVGATEINGAPGRVSIEQQGEPPLITTTPEQLIRDELGYELPVSQLNYWLRGIPSPGSRHEPVFGENNQLTELQQDGWTIRYMAYSNYDIETLPVRIRMEKPPLRVDLLRLNWSLDSPGIN